MCIKMYPPTVDRVGLRATFRSLMTLLVNEMIVISETQQSLYRLVQPEPDTIGLEFSECVVVLNDDGTWYLEPIT